MHFPKVVWVHDEFAHFLVGHLFLFLLLTGHDSDSVQILNHAFSHFSHGHDDHSLLPHKFPKIFSSSDICHFFILMQETNELFTLSSNLIRLLFFWTERYNHLRSSFSFLIWVFNILKLHILLVDRHQFFNLLSRWLIQA